VRVGRQITRTDIVITKRLRTTETKVKWYTHATFAAESQLGYFLVIFSIRLPNTPPLPIHVNTTMKN